jgi:hypothetical protein
VNWTYKIFTWIGLVIVTCFIAGFYGVLHDRITYSISPEYFTKFKYEQFGFEAFWFGGDRQTVGVIGFLATWWTGLIIGLVLATVALKCEDHKSMRKAYFHGLKRTFAVAVLFAFVGFVYGKFFLDPLQVKWRFPENLIDVENFVVVGSIHNFSYLGGAVGLIVGLVSIFKRK